MSGFKSLFSVLKGSPLAKADGDSKKANWQPLTDEHINQEYAWEYPNVKAHFGDIWPTVEHFRAAIKGGKVAPIDPSTDAKMGNRSRTRSLSELKDLVSYYQHPRDVDRIAQGLQSGAAMPTPIVLRHPETGAHHIMSGNTRMDTANILGYQPHAIVVDLPKTKPAMGKSLESAGATGVAALSKGANGDWQKEGYTIHHEIVPSEQTSTPHWYPQGKLRVFAKDKAGNEAASASINHAHSMALMKPRGISVGEGHERKGLATAMYQHAEKVMGKKMVPQDGHQSPAGAALWKQPNRPFGRKSEKKIENYSDKELDEYNNKLGMNFKKSAEPGESGDRWKSVFSASKKGALPTEGLDKGGAMKRHPFNPEDRSIAVDKKMQGWQDKEQKKDREALPRMEGNERVRALHKLAGKTHTIKGADGKRYFLLHRGMSPGEKIDTVDADKKVVNHRGAKSSWTPNFTTAESFASQYGGRDEKDPHKGVTSAWVHEDNIHTVPNQFGAIAQPQETFDLKHGTREVWPKKANVRAKNGWRNEHEVVVKASHKSHLTKAPASAVGGTSQLADVNHRINERAKGKYERDSTNDKAVKLMREKKLQTPSVSIKPEVPDNIIKMKKPKKTKVPDGTNS